MGNDRGLPSLPRGLPRDLTTYLQGLATVVLRLSGNVRGSEQVRAVRVSEGVSNSTGGGSQGMGQNEVLSWNLANRAVTTEKMVDGCVTQAKLGAYAVTEEKIASEAVVNGKLASSAVTAAKLAFGAVISEKLADGAVTEAKIANNAVSMDNIQDGAISAAKLGAGVVPSIFTGTAVDGETVVLPGVWGSAPVVMLTLVSLPPAQAPEKEPDSGQEVTVLPVAVTVGVTGLRETMLDTGNDGDSGDGIGTETGTGVWEFVAAGNFAWVAMGYAHG